MQELLVYTYKIIIRQYIEKHPNTNLKIFMLNPQTFASCGKQTHNLPADGRIIMHMSRYINQLSSSHNTSYG